MYTAHLLRPLYFKILDPPLPIDPGRKCLRAAWALIINITQNNFSELNMSALRAWHALVKTWLDPYLSQTYALAVHMGHLTHPAYLHHTSSRGLKSNHKCMSRDIEAMTLFSRKDRQSPEHRSTLRIPD